MLKVVAALKLSFICKTIFDITKLYMSCFSGCELHLIKEIIVCYFAKHPQFCYLQQIIKKLFVNKRLQRKLFSGVGERLVLSLILTGCWVGRSALVQCSYQRYIQRYNSLIFLD